MEDKPTHRKYERLRVGGGARMMVDTSGGLRMASGQLMDLSEGGCSILSKTRFEANLPARVQVSVAGTELWLPVVTRWVRPDAHGWMIGCSFDRPTPEKERAIRALLWERRKATTGTRIPK
jgi:hypothetical protein